MDVSNSEEFYLDRICNDLLANIEEQFEINQSLKELEETLRQDYTKIYEYGQRAQTLDTLNQVKVLKQSARENEEIKTRMISALTVIAPLLASDFSPALSISLFAGKEEDLLDPPPARGPVFGRASQLFPYWWF